MKKFAVPMVLFFICAIGELLNAQQVDFYFLRHGQTWANVDEVAQGTLNDERATLTPNGLEAAIVEAKIFDDYICSNEIHIDHMYISPARRTLQTAEQFLVYFKPDYIDFANKPFGPQPWGELEGQSYLDIVPGTEFAASEYAYINRDWKPAPCEEYPESESVNETAKRTLQGICGVYSNLLEIDPKKKWIVVVVTHSDIIKPIMEYITGEFPAKIPNCKVYHIQMSGIEQSSNLPSLQFIKIIPVGSV